MSYPKLAAYAALTTLASLGALNADAVRRPATWTFIAVFAYIAGRLQTAPALVLALVATVPPVVVGLIGDAAPLSAAVFAVLFGLVTGALAHYGLKATAPARSATGSPSS